MEEGRDRIINVKRVHASRIEFVTFDRHSNHREEEIVISPAACEFIEWAWQKRHKLKFARFAFLIGFLSGLLFMAVFASLLIAMR